MSHYSWVVRIWILFTQVCSGRKPGGGGWCTKGGGVYLTCPHLSPQHLFNRWDLGFSWVRWASLDFCFYSWNLFFLPSLLFFFLRRQFFCVGLVVLVWNVLTSLTGESWGWVQILGKSQRPTFKKQRKDKLLFLIYIIHEYITAIYNFYFCLFEEYCFRLLIRIIFH